MQYQADPAIEARAQKLFCERYKNYYDPNWDEVSERCRNAWRRKAERDRGL